MGKSKFRPPSRVDSLPFPVFGITWYGAQSSSRRDGCSVVAYCGGGGSAKTGVGNKIVVDVAVDDAPPGDDGGDAAFSGAGIEPEVPIFTSQKIEISTGEALCFGVHAFRPHGDGLGMVRLLACVGDEVIMYGIPLYGPAAESYDAVGVAPGHPSIFLGRTNVGKGHGANVAAYSPLYRDGKMHHHVAVGCEDGAVVIYSLIQTGERSFEFEKVAECRGHAKAVCAVNFHPRGAQLLSSAKDGTARVFDVRHGAELAALKCEVHDPAAPPPPAPVATGTTRDPRMMRRPPQILVRGCAYGDLEGKIVYTIASGKKGPAYLTRWRELAPPNRTAVGDPPGSPPADPPAGPPTSAVAGLPPAGGPPLSLPAGGSSLQSLSFNQDYRIQCSPVPVSATSLSSDGRLLTLGSVEGSISLYDLERRMVVKHFTEVHDLPVTCVASRPVTNVLMLPGELEEGVSFDAVSASADNRLGQWTLQRKSRISEPRKLRSPRRIGAFESFLWSILRIPLMLLLLLTVVAIRDTIDMCSVELSLSKLVIDAGRSAGHCLYREVLWAEESRVSFVPE